MMCKGRSRELPSVAFATCQLVDERDRLWVALDTALKKVEAHGGEEDAKWARRVRLRCLPETLTLLQTAAIVKENSKYEGGIP